MPLELIGATLEFLGKVMIGFTAIAVHYRVWREHRIDERVFREMRRERLVGILGILLMVAGYLLQLPSFFD